MLLTTSGKRTPAPRETITFVPHARRRDSKTRAIIDVALRVLVNDGVEALTLQRVARELGLTTTALYRYFPSKDALLAALQRQAVSEIHRELGSLVSELAPVLRRRSPAIATMAPVLAVAQRYLELPHTHPQTHHLVAVLLGDPRRLIADTQAVTTVPLLGALLGDVAGLLDAAALAGAIEPGPAHTRALMLWALVGGVNQLDKLARLAPDAPDRLEFGRTAVTTLLRGFGADPKLIARAYTAIESTLSKRSPL